MARIVFGLLLILVVAALFGDFFIWAALGTPFVLSPRFKSVHSFVSIHAGAFLVGLFLNQAVRLWKQRQWKALTFTALTFVAAEAPLAFLCASLVHLAALKGFLVFARPKIMLICFMFLMMLICKCYVLNSLWRLVRPVFAPRESRFVVASE